MRKRILSVFCICLLLQFLVVGTCFARPLPDPDEGGTISVTMRYFGDRVSDGKVTFYHVGEFQKTDSKISYTYTEDFQKSGVSLSNPESEEAAELLQNYVYQNKIAGPTKDVVNGNVTYQVSKGQLGLYLVMQCEVSDGAYAFHPFLISVPSYDGGYDYAVDASPKMGIPDEKPEGPVIPEEPGEPENPENPDEPGGFEDDDDNSGGNENGGDLEDNQEGGLHNGDDADKLPQTGQLNWPIPFLAVLGLVLFTAGWMMRNGTKEKTNEK